tara:strand:- start:118 stop:516 length:399 start_codon:yes stop_codon:yes gene_type:complete
MIQVYDLRSNGELIDIGYSKRSLHYRLDEHRRKKHLGKPNLTIHLLSKWNTVKEAKAEEGRLKLENGIEWSERKATLNRRTLTMDQAQEIKSKYITNNYTGRELAKQYNVTANVIYALVEGKTYLVNDHNRI